MTYTPIRPQTEVELEKNQLNLPINIVSSEGENINSDNIETEAKSDNEIVTLEETQSETPQTSTTSQAPENNGEIAPEVESGTEIVEAETQIEAKTPQALHQDLVERMAESNEAKVLKRLHADYKRQIYKAIASMLLPIYNSLLELGIKKKPALESKIKQSIASYLPETDCQKFAAKMTTKFSWFTQDELNELAEGTTEWGCEAVYTLIMMPKKNVIFGAIKNFQKLNTVPSKQDIQNYRQEVDPTRIPAAVSSKEFELKYAPLVNKVFKNEVEKYEIGDILDTIQGEKEQELRDKGEYIDGMSIPVSCGEIVQQLVKNHPEYSDKLKKLCPDIYKTRNGLKEKLEAEIANRKELEQRVKELSALQQVLIENGIVTKAQLNAVNNAGE